MPSFELPIRSLSVLFIFGALIAILWFPDNKLTPDMAYALFYWFLSLGVVRWIENGLLALIPTEWGGDWGTFWIIVALTVRIAALGFFVYYLISGIQRFVSALTLL